MSKIEWTGKTWNPVIGCSKISDGCLNCYAVNMATRLAGNPSTPQYVGVAERRQWTGLINVLPDDHKIWSEPYIQRAATRFFVGSMGDFFHVNTPQDAQSRVFDICRECPQHTFVFCTKRPGNMLKAFQTYGDIPDNIWCLTSVENQQAAEERIPILIQIPAAKVGISAEPLIGELDLTAWAGQLDWVIVGGETGRGTGIRMMQPEWVDSVFNFCQADEVPFFFKQWGSSKHYAAKTARGLSAVYMGRRWEQSP